MWFSEENGKQRMRVRNTLAYSIVHHRALLMAYRYLPCAWDVGGDDQISLWPLALWQLPCL